MKKWIYVVKLFVPVYSLQQNMALPKQNTGGWEVWDQVPAQAGSMEGPLPHPVDVSLPCPPEERGEVSSHKSSHPICEGATFLTALSLNAITPIRLQRSVLRGRSTHIQS